MPAVSVEHCLLKFHERLDMALKVGLSADQLFERSSGDFVWAGLWLRDSLAEQGILRIRRSWESFLESTFLRYLRGAECESGYSPTLTSPKQRSIEDARSFLLGPKQRYLKWDRYNIVPRAESHFSKGDPFKTAVNAVWQTLEEIATLRNRFAHKSENTRQEFHSLVRAQYGHLPTGITPGRFLLESPPSLGGNITRLEDYAKSLRGAAQTVVR